MNTLLTVLLVISLRSLNDHYHNAEQSSIVYYSPKTSVRLDFTYTEKTQKAGVYAEYAEELLGIKDAITENKTTYTLKGVEITTHTQVDLKRPHKIIAEKGFPSQYVSINENGLLVGYNIAQQPKKEIKKATAPKEEKPQTNRVKALPFTEEILEAPEGDARAQAVAKQIFRIRETRMYLLSGEVEHAPADGEAMREVLTELEKQEKQLVELFTGKTITRIKHKHMGSCPYGENFKLWAETLYFSEDNGFTDAENVDAKKISIDVEFQHQLRDARMEEEPKGKKGKNAVEPSPIVYNVPGNALVLVTYAGKQIGNKVVPMAQFGIDMPLPKDLFTGKELPVIVFSEKTGNIVSITK